MPLHQRGIGRRDLSPRIHPVGHRGVEPRATALSERPLHRLGSGQREVEVPTLYGLTAAHRHSKPAPAPAGHLPLRQWTSNVRHRSWRIAEVPPPNACAPTRVRAGGCSSAASLSTADGPGVEPGKDSRPSLRFPTGHLAARSTILARKVLGSNQRTTLAVTSVQQTDAFPLGQPSIETPGGLAPP